VISITSQADAIGQTIGGPGVGYIGLLAGVRTALFVGGCILSPALVLYARTLRHDDAIAVADGEVAPAEMPV